MAQVHGYTEDEIDQLSDEYVSMVTTAMDAALNRLVVSIESEQPVVAAGWQPSTGDADRITQYWDEEVAAGGLLGYLGEVHQGGAVQVALGTAEAFPREIAPGVVLLPNPFTADYIASLGEQLDGVGAELWDTVRAEIQAGVQNGEGIPEITDRLRKAAGLNKATAERVARTQVHAAAEAGSIGQARFMGYGSANATKTWIQTHDNRTRPTHQGAPIGVGGTTVRMDESFTVGGWPMDHPGDYTAPSSEKERCRCTMTFDLDAEPALSARCDGLTAAVGDQCVLPGGADEPTLTKMTVPQLRTRAKGLGIPAAGLRKPELIEAIQTELRDEFIRSEAPKIGKRASAIARLDQLVHAGEQLSERTIAHTVKTTSQALELTEEQAQEIRQLMLTQDASAVDALATRYGLTRVSPPTDGFDRYNSELYERGEIKGKPGVPIQVVSPAYAYTRQGERFVFKGRAIPATDDELQAYLTAHPALAPVETVEQQAARELDEQVATLAKLPVTQMRDLVRRRGIFVDPKATKAEVAALFRRSAGQTEEQIRAQALKAAEEFLDRDPPPTPAQLRAVGMKLAPVPPGRTVLTPGYVLRYQDEDVLLRPPVLVDLPPPATDYERRQRVLADLAGRLGEAQRMPLGGGALAKTDLFTFPDGTRVVRKQYGHRVRHTVRSEIGRQADAEELGALTLDRLGVRSATVYRMSTDEILMEFIEGETGADLRYGSRAGLGRVQRAVQSAEGKRLGLADFLISNRDRNMANYLLTRSGVVAIDNGESFLLESPQMRKDGNYLGLPFDPASGVWQTNSFSEYLTTPSHGMGHLYLSRRLDVLSPADLAHVRASLMSIRDEFIRTGRLPWFNYMLRRLTVLDKRATGTGSIY